MTKKSFKYKLFKKELRKFWLEQVEQFLLFMRQYWKKSLRWHSSVSEIIRREQLRLDL